MSSKPERKLPAQQLTILAICRFAEPISLTSIFPYLPSMIASFNVAANDIAFWAGTISAMYSICQALTAIVWGRLSDRVGRKPVILVGLTNTMITSLLWGFSPSGERWALSWAMVVRGLSGAGNGNVGIIRTMVAEMVPYKELQPRAFSIMPLVYNVGSVLGPTIGGALANPYGRKPEEPSDGRLLSKFPFALPNIVAAVFFFTGITVGILFLHETLQAKRGTRDWGLRLGDKLKAGTRRQYSTVKRILLRRKEEEEREPLLKSPSSRYPLPTDEESLSSSTAGELSPKQSAPAFREVLTKQSCLNLLVYTMLALHSIGFDALLPVFMHHPAHPSTPPQLPFRFSAGFGIDTARIGLLFTLYGVSGIFFQFVVFPPVAQRFGVLRCFRVCALAFPVIYFFTPFTVLVGGEGGGLPKQGAILGIMLLKNLTATFAFPCVTIMMTNSAASLRVLGTLNGIATSVSAVGRALGPTIGGTAFSWGVRRNLVITPFWTFTLLSLVAAIPTFFLVEGKGFGDDDEEDVDEDETVDTDEDAAVLSAEDIRSEALGEGAGDGEDEPLGPLISRTTTATSEAMTTDDEGNDSEMRQRRNSKSVRRRSSVPIGMGRGFRRMSSNLGSSRSGYGTGVYGSFGG